jgi:hypothetical protein
MPIFLDPSTLQAYLERATLMADRAARIAVAAADRAGDAARAGEAARQRLEIIRRLRRPAR